ncbi:response regulator receiver protein [Syntrophobacter fumaroxidans MPOB]|uniref:Response regulator receiver protein n=2 Tax=Syntrophobacter TaxID=29526 RepID=A0LFW5_SYNFM|nr:response regulator receiver protein [Syntrophobacter fumaroxidans MPOB]
MKMPPPGFGSQGVRRHRDFLVKGMLMEGFRVLVVDDETDFLETIVKRLRKRKVDAVGLTSGVEALKYLETEHFDVVILDVRMPGLDGIETLKEMKKKRPLMEVIMLTGHASVESGMQGMQLGAFDYVIKPADFDELMEKIRQARERKSIHEEKLRRG